MCQLHVLGATQSKQFPFFQLDRSDDECAQRQAAPAPSAAGRSRRRERAPPRPTQLFTFLRFRLAQDARFPYVKTIGTTTSEPRDGVHLSAFLLKRNFKASLLLDDFGKLL